MPHLAIARDLGRDGKVITWGLCDKGQLGRGVDATPSPAVVPEFKGSAAAQYGVPCEVKCGARHTGVVTGIKSFHH
jgi:hypothetical protein